MSRPLLTVSIYCSSSHIQMGKFNRNYVFSLISCISVSSHAASSSAVNTANFTNENFLYINYIWKTAKILKVDISKAVWMNSKLLPLELNVEICFCSFFVNTFKVYMICMIWRCNVVDIYQCVFKFLKCNFIDTRPFFNSVVLTLNSQGIICHKYWM